MRVLFSISVMLLALNLLAQDYPSQRYGHSVAYNTADSCYYIFGGNTQLALKSNKAFDPCVYKYNPKQLVFQKVCPQGSPNVSEHKAIYYNGKMIVLGGTKSVASETPVYDPTNQIWENIQYLYGPDARKNAAGAVILGNYIYYMGGKNFDNSVSNEVWKFDLTNNTFTLLSSMPQGGRYGHEVVAHNGMLLVFGGRNDNGDQSQMFSFNPSNESWDFFDPVGMPPSPRSFFDEGVLPNEMWMAGGETSSTLKSAKSTNSITLLTDIWKLDLSQNPARWIKKSQNFIPVSQAVGWISVENNDTLFYTFGGISQITTAGDTTFTNNFYRYNITDNITQQYYEDLQNWGGIITSINESEFKTSVELSVFPNPAVEQISVSLQTNEPIRSVKIYNQNGRLVQLINSKANIETINISKLIGGIYFLRIDTDKNFYLGKLIKK